MSLSVRAARIFAITLFGVSDALISTPIFAAVLLSSEPINPGTPPASILAITFLASLYASGEYFFAYADGAVLVFTSP